MKSTSQHPHHFYGQQQGQETSHKLQGREGQLSTYDEQAGDGDVDVEGRVHQAHAGVAHADLGKACTNELHRDNTFKRGTIKKYISKLLRNNRKKLVISGHFEFPEEPEVVLFNQYFLTICHHQT